MVFSLDHMLFPVIFTERFTDFIAPEKESLDVMSQGTMGGFLEVFATIRPVAARLILPVLLVAIALSMILSIFYPEKSAKLLPWLDKLAPRVLRIVFSLMLFMPFAILSAIFMLFKSHGLHLLTTVMIFIVLQVTIILFFLGLYYLLGYFLGSVKPGPFFNAMIPTYLLAASTRSSYACIASTTESAQRSLGIEEPLIATAIPFFLVTFRANRVISSLMNLQFIAYCLGINLSVSLIISFLFFQLLESIGSPGLPGSTRFSNLPFYLAAGIPVQAYLFTKSIDDIPDIFKTILNVTYPAILLSLVVNFQKALRGYRLSG
jgi:Na+/H+-dicarboxylate symporter